MSSELALNPVERLADLQQEMLTVHSEAIQHLSLVKADSAEVRRLEAELAATQAKLQVLAHGREHLTVVNLASMLKVKFQDNVAEGKLISKVSKRLHIPREQRADDRWEQGYVWSYHPYVCKVHCEEQGYKIPAGCSLKFALDPR